MCGKGQNGWVSKCSRYRARTHNNNNTTVYNRLRVSPREIVNTAGTVCTLRVRRPPNIQNSRLSTHPIGSYRLERITFSAKVRNPSAYRYMRACKRRARPVNSHTRIRVYRMTRRFRFEYCVLH